MVCFCHVHRGLCVLSMFGSVLGDAAIIIMSVLFLALHMRAQERDVFSPVAMGLVVHVCGHPRELFSFSRATLLFVRTCRATRVRKQPRPFEMPPIVAASKPASAAAKGYASASRVCVCVCVCV